MRGSSKVGAAMAVLTVLGVGWSATWGGSAAADTTPLAVQPLSSGFAVGTTTSQLTWSTTVQGDFAVRMTFDFDATELCTFVAKAAGAVGTNHVFSYFGHDAVGRTWTVWKEGHPTSVHASGLAVVAGQQASGLWATQHTHGASLFGEETWMYAGFGLRPWSNTITSGKSLIFDLSCTGPFTVVAIEGGKQLMGFSPDWMRGGVGATTGLGLPTSVNVVDSDARSFTEPNVHFRFRAEDQAAGGVMLVQTPGADANRILLGDDDVLIDGGSGSWGVTFTRVSAGAQQGVGVVAGMRGVPSLDAAVAI